MDEHEEPAGHSAPVVPKDPGGQYEPATKGQGPAHAPVVYDTDSP